MAMTDFHSHILPGIDDGSASVEESLNMLRQEREQGVSRVIATPHFYAWQDTPEHFLSKRNDAVNMLRKAMTAEKDLADMSVGAEVSYFRGISESEAVAAMTIQGTEYLMVEMPKAPWTNAMYEELLGLHNRGIVPIIAHVDRYIRPLKTYGIPARLAELPVLVQANAEFFLSPYTAPMALKLLKTGGIHLLGSDCHNLTTRRPNLGPVREVIQRKLGREALARLREYEYQIMGI